MDKSGNNKGLKITLLILVLIRVALLVLNKRFHIYILIFFINQSPINLILDISIIICLMTLVNYKVNKAIKYLLNSFSAIVTIMLILITIFLNCDKRYFCFPGPNKSKTLIVEEDSSLLSGRSRFYERKGLMFIKDIKRSIDTDDGFRPFSNDHYELKWLDDNSVELHYDFGGGSSEYMTAIIRLN
jgi:hypothetical protein